MSLSGMHSPHVSMSSNFSSSLGLAEMLGEHQEQERAAMMIMHPSSPRIDEHTPFLNGTNEHHQQVRVELNTTLLLTILVVTIGSSFQFGYATGELFLLYSIHCHLTHSFYTCAHRSHEQLRRIHSKVLSRSR